MKKISGVGNYILSEALYRSNLDPFASLIELDQNQRKLLYQEISNVALESYASQGMTREKGGTYRQVNGSNGSYTFSLQCYGQDVCPKGNKIIRETNGPHGRTIWYVEDQLFMSRDERESKEDKESVEKKSKLVSQKDEKVSEHQRLINLDDEITDDGWQEHLKEFLSSEKIDKLSNYTIQICSLYQNHD